MDIRGKKVNKSFTDDLKIITSGHPYHTVTCVWNDEIERFMVVVCDNRTKLTRILKIIENENGTFKHPDQRDVLFLINHIEWDMLDKYPNPGKMWGEIYKRRDYQNMKKVEKRNEWRKWFNKENKKQWRQVIEDIKGDFRNAPKIFA